MGQLFPVGGACYATTPLVNGTYAMASNNVPLSTNRVATIYPATQLAGIAGQTLTSLYLKKITATNIGGTPNFKVYLKNTSALDFGDASADWTTLVTGATLVYNSNPAVAAAGPAGWKEFVLSTNFNYTTGSNLMVLFEYVNTGNTTNVTWEYEWNNPCVDVTNDNTTKNQTNNDGTLPDLLTATNYRRAKIGFDYLVSCPAPTALTANNITTNSATVSWTAGGAETSWDYVVKPAGTGVPTTFTNVSTNSVNVNLAQNTYYDLYVRAACGGANGNSAWKGPFTFKTECAPVTSLFEGFETTATGNYVPDCWIRLAAPSDSGNQTVTTTLPATGTKNVSQYASATQTPVIVVLPELSNINDGTHRLRLKARVNSAGGGTLSVGYITDLTDMLSFVVIEDLNIMNTVYSVPNAEYSVVIPAASIPAGARLAIVNKNDGKTYYWDNVYWEPVPTCIEPTDLVSSSVTMNSAVLSWAPSVTPPALGYDVYYNTTGVAPDASTSALLNVPTATTTANLTGLNSGTTYYVWVRSKCSDTDKSVWKALPSLATECGVGNLPYVQNFESAATPALPSCTTKQNAGTGNNWVTISNPGYGFGTKALMYPYHMTNDANAWFFTQGLNLMSGITYRLTFDYGNDDGVNYTEKLKVAFGTTADAAAMTTQIADLPSISTITSQNATYTFTVPANGIYFVGFNAYSDAFSSNLFLDNINIEVDPLSTDEVNAKDAIKVYPNPFHDVVNISDVKSVKNIQVLDATGRLVKAFDRPSTQLHLGDLKSGLYILKLQHKDGTTTSLKVMKK